MNKRRFRPASAKTRWTVSIAVAVGAALVIAALGARPASGHEDADQTQAEQAAQMHRVLGSRSMAELFPSR